MKISNHSAVPVYTISGSSTARPLPEWLARKRKRSLKHDPEYASRIELLQDFEFEEASQCIRVSEDGQWVMSTGTYKPQFHTHYLPHLSLSYARHTDTLNTTFLLLSSDASKSLHLQSDRSLEFHTPLGCHYTTRLPRYGRDLIYDRRSAEALVTAVGVNDAGMGEVFRLNLEVGRYLRGYEVDVGGNDSAGAGSSALQGDVETGSVNVASIAEESHNLLAFGTSLGTVEFWDPRAKSRVGILHIPRAHGPSPERQEVTALEFDSSGLGLATGSSTGLIHLYDLRNPAPILKKDQGYGYPIHTIIHLTSSTCSQSSDPKILSADKRIIKIWSKENGAPYTSVEPAVDINSVAWCKDSGMFLTANEGRQQHAFHIPQLGPAPPWCSFLDNLVEEMAEDPNDPNAYTGQKAGEVFDNYKFLTVAQLESLNLSHLIGTTSLLRPYMHGYFVAQRLYEEAKLIADPFIWEDERNKRVKNKINTERESRIRGNKKTTAKVNKRLAEKMMERAERGERHQARKALERGGDEEQAETMASEPQEQPGGLLDDPRFAKLFQDEDFAIDERSHEFQSLNPSTKPTPLERRDGNEHKLTAVEEEALADNPRSSESGSSSDEEPATPKPKDAGRISSTTYARSGHRPQQPQKQQHHHQQQPQMRVTSSTPYRKPQQAKDRTFGSRATREKVSKPSSRARIVGEREITFAPERKGKVRRGEAVAEQQRETKRRDQVGRRSASGNVFRSM
ncbi:hypothetical protein MMC21_007510 [Puttea exsequens]|nr:hypothetical protein [Puttea exsequens]